MQQHIIEAFGFDQGTFIPRTSTFVPDSGTFVPTNGTFDISNFVPQCFCLILQMLDRFTAATHN